MKEASCEEILSCTTTRLKVKDQGCFKYLLKRKPNSDQF